MSATGAMKAVPGDIAALLLAGTAKTGQDRVGGGEEGEKNEGVMSPRGITSRKRFPEAGSTRRQGRRRRPKRAWPLAPPMPKRQGSRWRAFGTAWRCGPALGNEHMWRQPCTYWRGIVAQIVDVGLVVWSRKIVAAGAAGVAWLGQP